MLEETNTRAKGRTGEHFVQFYEEESFLVEEVLGFIGTGLWTGEAGVVIAPQSRLRDLEKRLSQCGLDSGSRPPYAGDYIFLDVEEVLSRVMVEGWPDEQRFMELIGTVIEEASNGGHVHVRAYGEMVSVLCAQGQRPAALRLEQLWNKLAQLHSFSLLCAYPMRSFSEEKDGKPFHDVCSAHSHVCLAESFTLPTGQDQLRRTIAILQQQAKALECEVARRKAIEKALHQREQELSDFLENAVEGMHRLGPDGKILWANKAELELLGYEKDEYIGLHVADFHIDRAAVQDILEKLRHGVTLYNYPAKIRCKDGSVKHVLMHSNAIVENGKLISTRCQTRDVTDRVHLEEKLNQRLRELADLHHRKDEFLAMLGHELHSLLAPVRTSLESMRTHNQDKTQIARSRDTIARHITHMTRLVDDLVQLQGGSVKACSKGSGKGGESTVTLPLQRTAEAREANSRNEGCAQDHRPSVERTILIVDDNADAAESLGEYLRTCGHSIYISYDGPSAITAASRIHPDVIILDIGLPTMNGYQVAQHLRSDEDLRSSLLVALTGYAQEGDRASAQAAGFDYHLAKPLDIKKLTTLLAEMK